MFFIFCAFLICENAAAASAAVSAQDPIERGRPNYLLDSAGNALALPQKAVLLNSRIDNHSVSVKTEQALREFISDYPEEMAGVKVRINQCAPLDDLHRLASNRRISWYWRIFPGAPATLWGSLTGRLFGGDNYNPFTHTIHLYSDDPNVALHEAGHAVDFARHDPGFDTDVYMLGRILPPVALHQESEATRTALEYLERKKKAEEVTRARSTLYPAYGTYVGAYSGVPYGQVVGAGAGHGAAWLKRKERDIARGNLRVGDPYRGGDDLMDNLAKSERGRDSFFKKAFSQGDLERYLRKENVK